MPEYFCILTLLGMYVLKRKNDMATGTAMTVSPYNNNTCQKCDDFAHRDVSYYRHALLQENKALLNWGVIVQL